MLVTELSEINAKNKTDKSSIGAVNVIFPYNNKALRKNIKRGKGERDGNFREGNKEKKKRWGWGRISSCRELNTSLNPIKADL